MLELEVAGEGVEGASESERSDDDVQASKKRVVAKYDLGRVRGDLESPGRPRGHW
jgi:hypothetical protein